VSAADAVLFMLTTSLSQDLYKRFVNPTASDATVLSVARWTTVASGTLGVLLAMAAGSVIGVLTIFYTLLGVTLFVPIVAGLYVRRASTADALAAIGGGIGGLLLVQATTGAAGWGPFTPALVGLLTAALAWLVSFTFFSGAMHGQRRESVQA
jgi:SSS family solute:Na+ symporter